jgi:hypothetical protein
MPDRSIVLEGCLCTNGCIIKKGCQSAGNAVYMIGGNRTGSASPFQKFPVILLARLAISVPVKPYLNSKQFGRFINERIVHAPDTTQVSQAAAAQGAHGPFRDL